MERPYTQWQRGVANLDLTLPAEKLVPVNKADADLPDGDCRSLLVGTAGTANLMETDGTIRTGVPLQQGYNPLRVRQVRAGGDAANIWAIY